MSCQGRTIVFFNHKNLEYFMSIKMLNRRQACWAQTLSQFKFYITCRPSTRNCKPDALTCQFGDFRNPGDEQFTQQQRTVLKPENLQLSLSVTVIVHHYKLFPSLRLTLPLDPLYMQLMIDITEQKSTSRFLPVAKCQIEDGLLYYRVLLYILDNAAIKLAILKSWDQAASFGHPGRTRTLELLSRYYFWPQMRKYTAYYIDNRDTCSSIKPVRLTPYSLLKLIVASANP